jgi:hypothetical protein
MTLHLYREPDAAGIIFGTLFINGRFQNFTLERTAVAIPLGTYPVVNYFSPHFNRQVPLLQNVPGRGEIEMHVGNYGADTDGCILQGSTIDRENSAINASQVAFNALFAALGLAWSANEAVTLTVSLA